MNRLNLPNRLYLKKLHFPIIIFAYTLISYYFWVFLFDLRIGRDEGQFLYIGKLVSEGNILYVDILTTRSPIPFYIIAFFIWLSGNNLYFVRLLVPLFNALTAIVIYLIGKENWSSRIGKIASILYVIGISMPLFDEIFLTAEPFEFLFGVLGIYYYLKNKRSGEKKHLFISGLCIGLSVLSKQYGLLFFFVLFFYEFLFLMVKRDKESISRFLRINTQIISGLLLPILSFLILALITGHLDAIIDVYLGGTASLASHLIRLPNLSLFLTNFLGFCIVFVFSLFFFWKELGLLFRDKSFTNNNLLMVWAFIFSLLFLASITGPYFAHTLLPSVLMAAIFIDSKLNLSSLSLNNLIEETKKNTFFSVIIVLLVGVSFLTNFSSIYFVGEEDRMPLSDQKEIAQYINENTNSDERILVFRYEPSHYYLSDRDPPSTGMIDACMCIDPRFLTEDALDELVKSVKDSNVRFLIVKKDSLEPDMSLTSWSGVPRDEKYPIMAQFKEFLRSNYELKEEGFKRFDIYYRESNSEWV